jgi:hypothetical protein
MKPAKQFDHSGSLPRAGQVPQRRQHVSLRIFAAALLNDVDASHDAADGRPGTLAASRVNETLQQFMTEMVVYLSGSKGRLDFRGVHEVSSYRVAYQQDSAALSGGSNGDSRADPPFLDHLR